MKSLIKYEVPTNDFRIIDALRGYGLVYVATPYSRYEDGLEAAYDAACIVTGELLKFNINAFSPIVHSHGIAKHAKIDPLDHAFWMGADKAHMEKADALLVMQLDGWAESVGIAMEIKAFKDAGKPIHFIKPHRHYTTVDVFSHKYGHWLSYAALLVLFAIVVFGN